MGKKRKKRKKSPPRVTAIARRETDAISTELRDDLDHAAELTLEAHAPATRRAYESDISAWAEFAKRRGLDAWPITASAFAAWVAHMDKGKLAVSTIRRRASAVAELHRAGGKVSPTDDPRIREVLRGLVRTRKEAPRKKRPLTAEMIRAMVDTIDDHPRDRALLLVGLVTGMRRSELAALCWEHVRTEVGGVVVTIPSSKTDQTGEGQLVAVPEVGGPYCAVEALWALRGRKKKGRVFGCADRTIARIVKRYAVAIKLDPDDFGAHSFRSGFATEAKRAGGSLEDIMTQTRHTSERIARGYIQGIEKMSNPAVLALARRLQGDEE